MIIIEYQHGHDFGVDYAPESYLNIGAARLVTIARNEARIMGGKVRAEEDIDFTGNKNAPANKSRQTFMDCYR